MNVNIYLNKPFPKHSKVERLIIFWSADEYDITNVERQMRAFNRLVKVLESEWIPNHPELEEITVIKDQQKWMPSISLNKIFNSTLIKHNFNTNNNLYAPNNKVVWIKGLKTRKKFYN